MSNLREVTTSHLRQNIGGVITSVTAGETIRLTRGAHTVAYLVSPRDWNELHARTVAEVADALQVKWLGIAQHVGDLVADPTWGRARTIVQADGLDAPDVLLTPDAIDEIGRRVTAARAGGAE